MKHEVIRNLGRDTSSKTIEVRLIPDNQQEKEDIMNLSESVQSYLEFNLRAMKMIEDNRPVFTLKVEDARGIGGY